MRIFLLLLLLLEVGFAQNREALLIGNTHYQFISNLNDTSSNLSSLQSALKGLNFNVIIKNDLNSKKLKQAIDEFQERLARSHDTIGFLYYSGHGCQLDNVGYLVPTNVNTKKKLDIKYDAMNIDKMLETLDLAGNRVNMLFLDACRDVPTNAKGSTKGLGQAPQRPKGTLLVYATEAGKTAEDNSKFINALISNINKPNKNIRDIAYDISNEVADQTGEGQIPEVFAKRLPEVVLRGGYVPPLIETIDGLMYQNQLFTKEDDDNLGKKRKGRVQTWNGAVEYCENLILGGYSDWRLPTKNELKKLLTETASITASGDKLYIRKEFAKYFQEYGWVWSSTEHSKKDDSIYKWGVLFTTGAEDIGETTIPSYALCVR